MATLFCFLYSRLSLDIIYDISQYQLTGSDGKSYVINQNGPLNFLLGRAYMQGEQVFNKRVFSPEISVDFKLTYVGKDEVEFVHGGYRKNTTMTTNPNIPTKDFEYITSFHKALIQMFIPDGLNIIISNNGAFSFYQFINCDENKPYMTKIIATLLLLSEGVELPLKIEKIIDENLAERPLPYFILDSENVKFRAFLFVNLKCVDRFKTYSGALTVLDYFTKHAVDWRSRYFEEDMIEQYESGYFMYSPGFLLQSYISELFAEECMLKEVLDVYYTLLDEMTEKTRRELEELPQEEVEKRENKKRLLENYRKIFSRCFKEFSGSGKYGCVKFAKECYEFFKDNVDFPFSETIPPPALKPFKQLKRIACENGAYEFEALKDPKSYNSCCEMVVYGLLCAFFYDHTTQSYNLDHVPNASSDLKAFFGEYSKPLEIIYNEAFYTKWNQVLADLEDNKIRYRIMEYEGSDVDIDVFNIMFSNPIYASEISSDSSDNAKKDIFRGKPIRNEIDPGVLNILRVIRHITGLNDYEDEMFDRLCDLDLSGDNSNVFQQIMDFVARTFKALSRLALAGTIFETELIQMTRNDDGTSYVDLYGLLKTKMVTSKDIVVTALMNFTSFHGSLKFILNPIKANATMKKFLLDRIPKLDSNALITGIITSNIKIVFDDNIMRFFQETFASILKIKSTVDKFAKFNLLFVIMKIDSYNVKCYLIKLFTDYLYLNLEKAKRSKNKIVHHFPRHLLRFISNILASVELNDLHVRNLFLSEVLLYDPKCEQNANIEILFENKGLASVVEPTQILKDQLEKTGKLETLLDLYDASINKYILTKDNEIADNLEDELFHNFLAMASIYHPQAVERTRKAFLRLFKARKIKLKELRWWSLLFEQISDNLPVLFNIADKNIEEDRSYSRKDRKQICVSDEQCLDMLELIYSFYDFDFNFIIYSYIKSSYRFYVLHLSTVFKILWKNKEFLLGMEGGFDKYMKALFATATSEESFRLISTFIQENYDEIPYESIMVGTEFAMKLKLADDNDHLFDANYYLYLEHFYMSFSRLFKYKNYKMIRDEQVGILIKEEGYELDRRISDLWGNDQM